MGVNNLPSSLYIYIAYRANERLQTFLFELPYRYCHAHKRDMEPQYTASDDKNIVVVDSIATQFQDDPHGYLSTNSFILF